MKYLLLLLLLSSGCTEPIRPPLVMDETTMQTDGDVIHLITSNEEIKDSIVYGLSSYEWHHIYYSGTDFDCAHFDYPVEDSMKLNLFIQRMNSMPVFKPAR